jgi:hypothetical protein
MEPGTKKDVACGYRRRPGTTTPHAFENEQEIVAMPKTNGTDARCPPQPSDRTIWWATIKVLTSGKLYRRLFWLLVLVAVTMIILAVLAACILLVRGPEFATIMHDLAIIATSVTVKP